MWRWVKFFILKKLYRILVIKVQMLDKSVLPSYHKFRTFCDLSFETNQGRFSFSFKEDRRSVARDTGFLKHSAVSYLVELTGPPHTNVCDNPLHNKVIVVIMVNLRQIDYEVLARLLLDLYIDRFPKRH